MLKILLLLLLFLPVLLLAGMILGFLFYYALLKAADGKPKSPRC